MDAQLCDDHPVHDPLRDLTHWTIWLRFRRMFGLFAFFYVLLHFSVYLLLDQSGKLGALWQDIVKRPTSPSVCWIAAVDSLGGHFHQQGTASLGKALGAPASPGLPDRHPGRLHFWWQVKKDIREPLLYVCGLTLLLGYRLWKNRQTLARVSVGAPCRDRCALSSKFSVVCQSMQGSVMDMPYRACSSPSEWSASPLSNGSRA